MTEINEFSNQHISFFIQPPLQTIHLATTDSDIQKNYSTRVTFF